MSNKKKFTKVNKGRAGGLSGTVKDISVVGDANFTLGFRLAGLQRIITTQNPKQELLTLLNDSTVGIIIVEEQVLSSVGEDAQRQLFESIDPVIVQLAETVNQDALRKMIQQSIGVDIMKDE